jgi:peroxiredoxin
VTIVGVSQNKAKDTGLFIKEYGVTFPVLLDDTNSYPVSNAYGLTNVPTVFWIDSDGTIEVSSVGWVQKEIEEINQKFAEAGNSSQQPVFRPDESIPAYRPG